MRVLTGCGMHIMVHACCVDSSVAFSLRAQLAAHHAKYCCSVVVLFFCRGSEKHFTYKMKCTVNQWTKLKICVWGGGGVALHVCDMYILHSHSHRHADE